MQDLLEFLDGIGRPRVTLLGDFMLDRYVYGDCERISPEAPVPVLKIVRRESHCGGAASVAADILALGAEVSCIGVIGRDETGDELLSLLSSNGAETASLLRLDSRPTTTKHRMVGLAQHRHEQQMMRVDEEISESISEEVLTSIRASMRGCLTDCKVLALEDYNKGMLTDETGPRIIAEARAAGAMVLVDPALIADYRRYAGCTLLTPNRFEASLASGIEVTDESSAERAAEAIVRAAEAEGVVITMDKQGAYVKQVGKPGRMMPTRKREVYDVSGAGDEVLATLAVAFSAGADWETAAALSNVAGGLAVERFGTVPVRREEIRADLLAGQARKAGKILSADQLAVEVRKLKRAGRAVVWTNGCFDILHAGHVEYLRFARQQGDALIVGVNSDRSVRENKGPNRPIVPQGDRVEVLAALEFVDYVVIYDEPTPLEMIDRLLPDVLVKGADWRGAVVGQAEVEAAGGRVVLADLMEGRSTTDIINRITSVYGRWEKS